MYTAQDVWEHRKKYSTGTLGDETQSPYKMTFQYQYYELKMVDVFSIKSDFEDYQKSLSSLEDENCAIEYSKLDTEPPAIVLGQNENGYFIIDGRHRLRSSIIKGKSKILAFVGINL